MQVDATTFPVPQVDFMVVLPIVIVMTTGILALIAEMLWPKRNNNIIVGVSLVGLLAAAVSIATQFSLGPAPTMANMVMRDHFGLVIQLLLVGACFLTVLFSDGYLRAKGIAFGEFYPLVIWSTGGAMLMVTTTNLLVIFLGLELLSIALYVMAGMSRKETKSEESAMKYFLLGAFASGFLLYGMAFFYGATGSLDITALGQVWDQGNRTMQTFLVFGIGLMLVGFGFKSAFVPFHQWTPDVYQGAPTNVTAFMAAGSKIAAIASLLRLLEAAAPAQDYWMTALVWIAALTMTVGNLVALIQKDLKRILGYSSIAHAGYLLVALLAYSKKPELGTDTTTYYLLAYTLMTLGAFAVISMIAKDGHETTRVQDLNGLWQRSPWAAGALVIFMISLIGVPPTAGFWGKFFIFKDAVDAGLTALAIVLAVNSAISAFYYLGIGYAAFVAEADPTRIYRKVTPALGTTLGICAAGIIGATFLFTPIMRWLNPGESAPAVANAETRAFTMKSESNP